MWLRLGGEHSRMKDLPDLQSEVLRLRVLNSLLREIRNSLDTTDIILAARDHIGKVVSFDRLGLLVAQPKGKYCIVHELVTKSELAFCPPGSFMEISGTAIEWVFRELQPHSNPDLENIREFAEDVHLFNDKIQSIVRIPFFHGGTVFGIMTVKSTEKNHFTQSAIEFLSEVADHLSASLYFARMVMDLKLQSYTDPLTGLFNRRALHEIHDQQSLLSFMDDLMIDYDFGEDIHSLAVLLIDLDDFKGYNDANGHLEGDKRLQAIAKVLRYATPGHQLIFRYGGDEFVILLPNATELQAHNVAAHIRQGAVKNGDHRGESILVSIGVHNDIWGELSQLLLKADAMMYANKRNRPEDEVPTV